ncbi:MAG: hypothetical protein IJB68_01355 [Ruminococcus sp.]|nr:hypothetical protein [Ruminococcus sp.]
MIIGFTKQMHTHIVGQPQRKSKGQQKRVDSFIYSFITNVQRRDMDWDGLYDAVVECLIESMGLSLDAVKDMELSLDITSGQYAVRFTAIGDKADLTEDAYAAEIRWTVQSGDAIISPNLEVYPMEYVDKDDYSIIPDAAALTLAEVEALIVDDIED